MIALAAAIAGIVAGYLAGRRRRRAPHEPRAVQLVAQLEAGGRSG